MFNTVSTAIDKRQEKIRVDTCRKTLEKLRSGYENKSAWMANRAAAERACATISHDTECQLVQNVYNRVKDTPVQSGGGLFRKKTMTTVGEWFANSSFNTCL